MKRGYILKNKYKINSKKKILIHASASFESDPYVGARSIIERAREANQVGLDLLSLGDHHLTPVNYFQNVPMLGRLLAEWQAGPVGCLFLLPLWNRFRLIFLERYLV